MQFNPSDSGIIGTTQGICPTGWHMPTEKEWGTLIDYLGNKQVAGGKLKETGTLQLQILRMISRWKGAQQKGLLKFSNPFLILLLGNYLLLYLKM